MIKPGSIFRHYKNNKYKVLCVAKNLFFNESLVIYSCLNNNKIWARPKNMFLETIKINGVNKPRFEYISWEAQKEEKDIIIATHTEELINMIIYKRLDKQWVYRDYGIIEK